MKFRQLFKYYLFFLSLLLLRTTYSSSKIISISFRKASGAYSIGSTIKFSESLSEKAFIGAINLQSQFSFFAHPEFNYKNSNDQYDKVIVQLENKNIECKKLTLPHTLSYLSNINLTFYNMIDNKYQIQSNYFSFAYRYIKEEFSIIDTLKTNGEIENRKLFFDPFLSFFHLGGVPEGRVEKKKSFTCDINKMYFSWGCTLNSITLGDLTSSFWYFNTRNTYFYFQASVRYIYVSNQFYSYLMTQFFRDRIYKKECIIKKDKGVDVLLCANQVIQNFPKITFIIDRTEASFPMKKLFESNYDGGDPNFLEFLIRVNDCDELWEREFFVFGTIFMDNFMIELNKDDNKITFYSDNPFPRSQLFEPEPLIEIKSNNSYRNYLYILLILILFVNSVFLFMLKIDKCNNTNLFLLSN